MGSARGELNPAEPKYLTPTLLMRALPGDAGKADQLWNKASLPIITEQRMEFKLKDFINKYDGVRENKMLRGKKIGQDWIKKLFDIVVNALSLKNL